MEVKVTKLKYLNLFLIVSMTTLLVVSGCSKKVAEGPFDIIFTGNLIGTVAPCNCPSAKAGGLPRRAAFLDSLKSEPQNRLYVDAGNYSSIRRDIGQQKSELLIAGMLKLGLHAISPSYKDLNRGIEPLEELLKLYPVPYISANVVVRKTKEHPFPGHRIVELGRTAFHEGMKVAIIGMAHGSKSRKLHRKAGILFDDPVEAFEREFKLIPDDVEYTILLTDAPREQVQEWFKSIEPGRIDLIVCSNSSSYKRGMQKVNDIPFATTSRMGKYFDYLTINRKLTNGWNIKPTHKYLSEKTASNIKMIEFLKKLQQTTDLTDSQVGDFHVN